MARKLAFTQRQLSRIVVLWAKYQPFKKLVRVPEEVPSHQAPSTCAYYDSLTDVITGFNETDLVKLCSGGGLENSVRTSENILSQSLKDVMKDDMTLSVGALSIQLDFNLQFGRVNN